MNHYLYPYIREKIMATPVYGNVAIISLVRMMEEAGCRREDLIAHILGGAHPADDPEFDTGERNIKIARKALAHCRIMVASEDTGGFMGRKIVFDTITGHVAVLKVYNIRSSDWYTDKKGGI
ncbi:Chemotaxis protein CheD [Chitinispirillum alkaliphilum]|nr:Chemotaxis protein CheD [Chitinispirillum alkaliphilum]